jgi:hypothetical protein
MNTGVGERELSAIVGEPVPLREVGNLPMLWVSLCGFGKRGGSISGLDRFPLLGEKVRVRGHHCSYFLLN